MTWKEHATLFMVMIKYKDRQSWSYHGKELLRNEKDLIEANLGSSMLGRQQCVWKAGSGVGSWDTLVKKKIYLLLSIAQQHR